MRNTLLSLFAVLLISGCAKSNQYDELITYSEEELQESVRQSSSLAIAFGGGGIRGFMHLGVIKALEENGIRADIVTGSSAGSIAAALYASGLSYEQLENIINDVSELELADIVISSRGFVNGKNIAKWVNASVPQTNLHDMPIAIGITATDMNMRKSVLIREGNVGEAVQTSSTIPGAFVPVEHHGHILVDGGILTVVPVNYARKMGADFVVAVDIYCGNQPEPEMNLGNITLSTFRMLSCTLAQSEINNADIVISPDFEPENSSLFSSKEAAIQAGYQATLSEISNIVALIERSNGSEMALGQKR